MRRSDYVRLADIIRAMRPTADTPECQQINFVISAMTTAIARGLQEDNAAFDIAMFERNAGATTC